MFAPDRDSAEFGRKVNLVDQQKWQQCAVEDDTLQHVSLQSLDGHVLDLNGANSLQDYSVSFELLVMSHNVSG